MVPKRRRRSRCARYPPRAANHIRQALKIADDVYVLELGRNKFEGPAFDFDDLEKAFWVS